MWPLLNVFAPSWNFLYSVTTSEARSVDLGHSVMENNHVGHHSLARQGTVFEAAE